MTPYPLFKGIAREATVGGVPLVPLALMLGAVAIAAMLTSLWMWAIAPILWLLMAAITKHDDRAFRIWALALDTKLRNLNKRFWGASSYAPMPYRRQRGRR